MLYSYCTRTVPTSTLHFLSLSGGTKFTIDGKAVPHCLLPFSSSLLVFIHPSYSTLLRSTLPCSVNIRTGSPFPCLVPFFPPLGLFFLFFFFSFSFLFYINTERYCIPYLLRDRKEKIGHSANFRFLFFFLIFLSLIFFSSS